MHSLVEMKHGAGSPVAAEWLERQDVASRVQSAVVLLGAWIALAPFTLGYFEESLWIDPPAHELWFGIAARSALRAWLMAGSDIVCGLALIAVAAQLVAMDAARRLRWICGIGAWIHVAPVLIWAPTTAAYLHGTAAGLLVILLAIARSSAIAASHRDALQLASSGRASQRTRVGGPPRALLIAGATLVLLAMRYVAMNQLGYVDDAWGAYFGESTLRMVSSSMRALPLSDVGMGALTYTVEFLRGWADHPGRWPVAAWILHSVAIPGLPLVVVHAVLAVFQPVVVAAWCLCCLVPVAMALPTRGGSSAQLLRRALRCMLRDA